MVMIQLCEPSVDGLGINEACEVAEQIAVSGGHSSELFELVEKALDDVALFVEIGVIGSLDYAIVLGRNDGSAAEANNRPAQMSSVVTFVSDGGCGGKALIQVTGECYDIALARRPMICTGFPRHRLQHGFWCSSRRATCPGLGHQPPFSCGPPGCMLMRSDNCCVNHQPLQIGFAGKPVENDMKNALFDPAIIAPLHRLILA